MAVKLLQVLVLGVIAAAADDDVPITWLPSRYSLPCQVPGADRIPARRPPPPLDAEDRARQKPYVWRRGDEELKRVSNNGTLEVSKKRKDSEGIYQCSTKYQGGKVLGYPVNLKFAYLYKNFSVHPSNATAWRGQPYVLMCDISSGPPASISWLRDGKPLPDDSRYIFLKNQLLITEVFHNDTGLYRCRATNSGANKSRTSHGGRLAVEDSPGDLETSFLPVLYERNISTALGSRVVLACPIVGDNKPKLIWELTAPGQRTAELESVEENLILSDIHLDQAGVYTCKAEGISDLVKTFNVTLTEPVSIIHAPNSKQALAASTVRFNCTATGRPEPRITWYKDGKKLQLTDRINVMLSAEDKTPQLLIRSVTSEDAGVYQCFARNSVSVKSAWAVLNLTDVVVDAPGSLRCWPAGAATIILKWTCVPHDVIAYTVHAFSMPGGSSYPEQPFTNTTNTIKVKLPLTPYGFRVRVYTSKGGASDLSLPVVCEGQGVPIKLTKFEEDANSAILVSWEQFYKDNPGVVEWILQYRGENSTKEKNVTIEGHVYNYTLKVSTLKPIQVRVLGTRSLPWSHQDLSLVPWSSSATASHQLAPGEMFATPFNVEVLDVNPRNFTVRWQYAQERNYAYLVCVKMVGGSDDCQDRVMRKRCTSLVRRVRASSNNILKMFAARFACQYLNHCCMVHLLTIKSSYLTNINIGHLEPDTDYEVRVKAKLLGKAAGGDFSAPILTSTPPEDEVQHTYTRDALVVSWRGAGPRVVKYSQNLTQPVGTWHSINTTTQTHVQITGLDRKRSTFVMVAAPGPRDQGRYPVKTFRPPPLDETSNIYMYIGIGCGVILLFLLGAAAFCIWRKRKVRSRIRTRSPIGTEEEATDMQNVGDRLANSGGSKDAGEPLLNGHVHITENPSQSKTPNGKIRKGYRCDTAMFDFARYDEPDTTLETVLDDSTNTNLNLFDTSRRPEFDHRPREVSPNSSFNKLPDDNMNSEITRSTFELDNSKILPTLQPNG